MPEKHLKGRQLNTQQLDEGLITLASLAAEKMGISLPLFVNQALQEKLLKMIDVERDNPAAEGSGKGEI